MRGVLEGEAKKEGEVRGWPASRAVGRTSGRREDVRPQDWKEGRKIR